jgi:hypothetical protein
MGKDLEEGGGGLILRHCPGIHVEALRKTTTKLRTAGLPAEI